MSDSNREWGENARTGVIDLREHERIIAEIHAAHAAALAELAEIKREVVEYVHDGGDFSWTLAVIEIRAWREQLAAKERECEELRRERAEHFADWRRIAEWLQVGVPVEQMAKPKPAHLAFTEGPERKVANLLGGMFDVMWGALDQKRTLTTENAALSAEAERYVGIVERMGENSKQLTAENAALKARVEALETERVTDRELLDMAKTESRLTAAHELLRKVRERLSTIIRHSAFPANKRTDAEFLRACCVIAKEQAAAELAAIDQQFTTVPRLCGRVPPNHYYAPCTREAGHSGPCAHELEAGR